MEQSKLDKYLKVVMQNKQENETHQRSVFLPDMKEEFSFRTLTPAEVREVTFSLPYDTKCFADIYKNKVFKRTIYNACDLATLATKAKEQGLISSYYDIIDYLFSPNDVLELWLAIMKENKIGGNAATDEQVEELKN